MERTMSPEERIRRAEEIYYRRKSQKLDRNSIRIRNEEKVNSIIVKKMILQIIICIVIYSIFYMIQNTDYIFSEDVINKTKEILVYDINIQNLYNKSKEYINSFISNVKQEENEENQENDQTENENDDIEGNDSETENVSEGNIGGEEVANTEENLTEMERDAKDIIATKSLIIPLKGTITSRYGPRNPTDPKVSKYHTGIDIAVNTGTVFIASMEGVVEEVSSEGDYGNHVKITNGDVMTLYAHCNKIYVNKGDLIKQGQEIGEVGATGNVTGPHLHFEIRKENRYVDPELILDF
ncbi:MAG: M23 family metallopeptidase [Clostridia bacterium]